MINNVIKIMKKTLSLFKPNSLSTSYFDNQYIYNININVKKLEINEK